MNNRNTGEVTEVGAIGAINGHGITSQAIQVTKEVPQAPEVDAALAYFNNLKRSCVGIEELQAVEALITAAHKRLLS